MNVTDKQTDGRTEGHQAGRQQRPRLRMTNFKFYFHNVFLSSISYQSAVSTQVAHFYHYSTVLVTV